MTPNSPGSYADEVPTPGQAQDARLAGTGEDGGEVSDMQIQRWKEEGGSLLPLD